MLQFEGEDARAPDEPASDDEHERETVPAPPPVDALYMREDETLRVVMTLASEAFRTSSGTITTPALSQTRPVASHMPAETSHDSATMPASDDDETRRVTLDPVRIEQEAGLRFPQPPVSRALQAHSLSVSPGGLSSRPPALQSLSPTERSRPETRPGGRALLWPAMTAALLLALGASALLRQMASSGSPAPQHATRELTRAPTHGTARQHNLPAALLEPKPADAATVAALQADASPLPKSRRASLRKRRDNAALPETPEREDVLTAMTPVRDAIRDCAGGRGGVAELDLSVASSGAVLHALVHGDYAGTPQGSCIARAARKARFSPFRRDRFRVLYPMSL